MTSSTTNTVWLSQSYIRELDSQRLVASVLDGPWRSTTYSNDDNESVEQAASDDVAMLQSIDKNLYAANKVPSATYEGQWTCFLLRAYRTYALVGINAPA